MFKKENLSLIETIPRRISWTVVVNAFFGGATSLLGVGFLSLGLLFAGVFLKNLNIDNLNFLIKPYQTAPAVVQQLINTGETRGKTKTFAGEYLYKVIYEYKNPDLEAQKLTGRDFIYGKKLSHNQSIQIDYLLENHQITRLAGQLDWSEYWVFLCLIFPIIGLILVVGNFIEGWRYCDLLHKGELTYGELGEKELTDVRINKHSQFKMGFAFKAKDGRIYKTYIKTISPQALEDDALEPLLFDSKNPSRAMLLDEFPNGLYVSFDGKIKTPKIFITLVLLLQPLILIVVMLYLLGILKTA